MAVIHVTPEANLRYRAVAARYVVSLRRTMTACTLYALLHDTPLGPPTDRALGSTELGVDAYASYAAKRAGKSVPALLLGLLPVLDRLAWEILAGYEANLHAVQKRYPVQGRNTPSCRNGVRASGWRASARNQQRVDPALHAALFADKQMLACSLCALIESAVLATAQPPTGRADLPVIGVTPGCERIMPTSKVVREIFTALRVTYNMLYNETLSYYYYKCDREKLSLWAIATPKQRAVGLYQLARHPIYANPPLRTKEVLWEWI